MGWDCGIILNVMEWQLCLSSRCGFERLITFNSVWQLSARGGYLLCHSETGQVIAPHRSFSRVKRKNDNKGIKKSRRKAPDVQRCCCCCCCVRCPHRQSDMWLLFQPLLCCHKEESLESCSKGRTELGSDITLHLPTLQFVFISRAEYEQKGAALCVDKSSSFKTRGDITTSKQSLHVHSDGGFPGADHCWVHRKDTGLCFWQILTWKKKKKSSAL